MESQGSKRVRGRNTENILNASHTSVNQGRRKVERRKVEREKEKEREEQDNLFEAKQVILTRWATLWDERECGSRGAH
ncbi:hypothetical protein AgCh_038174 [Apium graveolens]